MILLHLDIIPLLLLFLDSIPITMEGFQEVGAMDRFTVLIRIIQDSIMDITGIDGIDGIVIPGFTTMAMLEIVNTIRIIIKQWPE